MPGAGGGVVDLLSVAAEDVLATTERCPPRMKFEKALAAASRTPVSESESAAVSVSTAFDVPLHGTLCKGGGVFTGCVAHQCPP